MHEAEVVRVLAELMLILLSAKLFGELAERLDQPAVLGELIGGVVLGTGLFTFFRTNDPSLGLMSEIGVLLLLFETGLHSDLSELLNAGPTSAAVAATGVAVPFALGWGLMTALGYGGMEAVFVGAAMTATSVGITARVLADIGRLDAPEARIVLGAAVIDDVLGVVILSAVEGIAASGAVSWPAVARAAVLAALFLAAALWAGPLLTRQFVKAVRQMRVRGVLVGAAVVFAFALALIAHAAGTAMIVGAFTAGILLAGTDKREDVQAAVQPVVDVFAPVFFVMVGAHVRLETMNPFVPGNREMLGLAALLIVAAVIGKVVSGLAVFKKGIRRWSVGVGMIPRGEVGLIFASIGLASGAIDAAFYAAVVLMVVVTTFVAPPLLKRSLS
jgi:Na+:H+ antiporter